MMTHPHPWLRPTVEFHIRIIQKSRLGIRQNSLYKFLQIARSLWERKIATPTGVDYWLQEVSELMKKEKESYEIGITEMNCIPEKPPQGGCSF